MPNLFPFSFRSIGQRILLANEAGDFFITSENFLERLNNNQLTAEDEEFLLNKGFAFKSLGDFFYNSFIARLRKKKETSDNISYIIAIPTLRCDLACDYCQVSRASVTADGFDWDDLTVIAFKKFIKESPTKKLKIEFQGGEPTLRLDIIKDVIFYCRDNDIEADFVICTNLTGRMPELLKLLDMGNVYISTSIDGPPEIQSENRTKNIETADIILKNYNLIRERFGQDKIAAFSSPCVLLQDGINLDYYFDLFRFLEVGVDAPSSFFMQLLGNRKTDLSTPRLMR